MLALTIFVSRFLIKIPLNKKSYAQTNPRTQALLTGSNEVLPRQRQVSPNLPNKPKKQLTYLVQLVLKGVGYRPTGLLAQNAFGLKVAELTVVVFAVKRRFEENHGQTQNRYERCVVVVTVAVDLKNIKIR